MTAKQHVILCEGYDDRAFWAGLLMHLGCRNRFNGKTKPVDPWGRPVTRGEYAFETRGGSFIRIQPYQGRSKLRDAVRLLFQGQQTRPVDRLIINLDSDAEGDQDSTSARDQIDGILRDQDPAATPDAHGMYRIQEALIAPIVWACGDAPDVPGIPAKQTLERLVSAAIAEAYPGRGQAVDAWLRAEPVDSAPSHKHHGLSYLAKWYAEHGCDDFYKELWRDATVAAQLERRLHAQGAWQHIRALAEA